MKQTVHLSRGGLTSLRPLLRNFNETFLKSIYATLTNPFYLQGHKHSQRTPADFWSQFDATKAVDSFHLFTYLLILFYIILLQFVQYRQLFP